MNLTDAITLVKPKRLYEDRFAYLYADGIMFELGATTIVVPAQTPYPRATANIKDLYSGNEAAFVSTAPPALTVPKEGWSEMVVTAQDLTIFSALAAAGEDTFFCGKLNIEKNRFNVIGMGMIYFCEFGVPKILGDVKLDSFVDWQVFYYLFQMFKHLSGKKTDKLLWQQNKYGLWLTNEIQSFFVRINTEHKDLKFKSSFFNVIDKVYDMPKGDGHSVMKKTLLEESESLLKHLTRPFGDQFNWIECKQFNVYTNKSTYTLMVNKVKTDE